MIRTAVPGEPSRYWVVLAMALSTTCIGATVQGIEELDFRRVDRDFGLPHQSVYVILQDRVGYLWVGTADGLARYDGYGTRVWRHRRGDPNSLPHSTVYSLLEDDSGALWIGTSAGLAHLKPDRGHLTRVDLPLAEGETAWVYRLRQGPGGRIWAATAAGLFVSRGGEFVREDSGGIAFLDVLPEATSTLVLYSAGADGELRVATLVDGEPRGGQPVEPAWHGTPGMLRDSRGRLWIAGRGPHDPDWTPATPLAPPVTKRTLFDALDTPELGLLLATVKGICLVGAGECSNVLVASATDYLGNEVRGLYRDRQGRIWAGTHAGLYCHDPYAQQFKSLSGGDLLPQLNLASFAVSSVYKEPGGDLWIGTFGNGLIHLSVEGWARQYRHKPDDPGSLPGNIVWSLARQHGTTRLWVGLAEGVARIDLADGSLSQVRLPGTGGAFPLAADAHGRIWFRAGHSIYSIEPDRQDPVRHKLTPGDGALLQGDRLTSIRFFDGVLWLGARSSVLRYDPQRGDTRHYSLRDADGRSIAGEGLWWIESGTAGKIWLGSSGGLHELHLASEQLRHFGRDNGLPGSIVYAGATDTEGALWLSTNNGLTRFDSAAQTFQSYGPGDGTGSREFNRRAVHVAEDGELLFGGMRGVTRFYPDRIRKNPVRPPVVINSVSVFTRGGGTTHRFHDPRELELDWRESTFSFQFAALNFTEPEANRYRYRLHPFETEWVEAGLRRVARYTNIPPGSYEFQVLGSNNDGLWSAEPASLALSIAPAYWQTRWFRAALVVLGLLLAILAYRLRVRYLLDMERIRLRIAGDLHDDVGSDLSAVALVTGSLRYRDGLDASDRRRLDDAHRVIRQVSQRLRDIVWITRPEHDNLKAVIRHMKSIAQRFLGDLEYTFEDRVKETSRTSMIFRRDIILVFKELLHNIVRHSAATRVWIVVETRKGYLTLEIGDDGDGFESGAVGPGSGLAGIARRAAAIGGQLSIETAPGSGTTVRLTAKMA